MGRRGPRAGALLCLALVTACGDQGDGGASSPDAGTMTEPTTQELSAHPWLTADGDTLVTCSGGPAFPAARVAAGGLERTPEESDEILTVLEAMKQDFGIDAPRPLQEAEADQVPWAVVWEESVAGTDHVGILLAEAGASGFDLATDEYASLEWQGDTWRASSWSGTCGARPFLPVGFQWAQVGLPDPASDQTGATVGAAIDLMVSEVECTSARDPQPFLAEPVVLETAESVTFFWTTEAMTGDANCPGNPWVSRSVQLDEPLGERVLLDGSSYPPRPVRTVEEIQNGPPARR